MNLNLGMAQVARRLGYRERVFELLLRARALHRDATDPVELRWEASQCLGDFVALNSTILGDFPTNIESTCVDSSGRLAAFGLANSTIVLSQVPSGEIVARLRSEPGLKSLRFSADSDQLLSVHQSNRVCRWSQAANGQWLEAAEKSTVPGVFACLSSAQGQFLAVNNASAHRVELLDPKTRTLVRAAQYPPGIQTNLDLSIALSRDNRFLAIGGDSTSNGVVLQIWDCASEQSIVIREPGLANLFSLNFSDDSEYLSCLSNNGGRIYSRAGWQAVADVRDTLDFDSPKGVGVAFAPEGTVAAWPVTFQGSVRLVDWTRNEDLAFLKEPLRAEQVAFAVGGQFLTSGRRQARLYHLNTPEKLNLTGHRGGVKGVAFSPDNSNIASVGEDKTVRIWDLATCQTVWVNQLPGRGQTIAYSPDGDLLAASVRAIKSVLLWDARTGRLLSQLETPLGSGVVWSVLFSPDGRYLAAAGGDGVKVWAFKGRTNGAAEPWTEPTPVRSFGGRNSGGAVFSMDSRYLAFCDKKADHHDVDVWDFMGAAQPRTLATNVSASVQDRAFTPDDRYLLSTDSHRAVVTFELSTGKEVSRFVTEELSPEEFADATRSGYVPGICLSPDGTKLAVSLVSRPGVEIWDPRSGRRLYSLADHNGSVWWLAWSADSSKLAVSRSNGDISVWKLPEIERVLAALGLKP